MNPSSRDNKPRMGLIDAAH